MNPDFQIVDTEPGLIVERRLPAGILTGGTGSSGAPAGRSPEALPASAWTERRATHPEVAGSSPAPCPIPLLDLQAVMLAGGQLYDPQEVHTFVPGLYIRQVTNPAGSLTITMKHATEHPYFVLRGHIRVANLETGEVRDLRGGDSGVTLAGTQRAILALEETVFCTVHPNPDNCTDLRVLEERFILRQELPGGRTAGELYREQLAKLLGGAPSVG